jgi:hypothetical protein
MTDYTILEPYCPTHNTELHISKRRMPFVTVYHGDTTRLDLNWNVVECVPFATDPEQDRDRRACQATWTVGLRRETR